MNQAERDFLKEYKKLCLKHGFQILGFDDGAYLLKLNEDEKQIAVLGWKIMIFPDGSKNHSDIRFYDRGTLHNRLGLNQDDPFHL